MLYVAIGIAWLLVGFGTSLLIGRALPIAENNSRALQRHLAKRDPQSFPNGDCFPVFDSVHAEETAR